MSTFNGPQSRLSGTNLQRAGDLNQRVVLHTIRVHGPITKTDIAHITGLTHPSVTNITNRLQDDGLLAIAGLRRGSRGQPATRLIINPEGAFSVGINIDRDHITMVVVDFSGDVRARLSQEIDFPSPDYVQSYYRKNILRLLLNAGIEARKITGIGVALPDDLGKIDLPGKPAEYAHWNSVVVRDLFASPLDLPVCIENDAAAAAIGEMQFGLGQRYASFFYVLITYALGGGLVIESFYDRGAHGRSGEIGFIMVDDGAGGQVPLQNIVSLAGLSARLSGHGFTRAMLISAEAWTPQMETIIEDWINAAALALVQPLIAVNCLINPEAVLIGGRLPNIIVDRLAQKINLLLRQHGGHVPVIAQMQRAALAADAPAVGAAILLYADMLMPSHMRIDKPVVHAPLKTA